MTRLIEVLWLLIGAASIIVFFYVLFDEGFVAGKAWPYLITAALGGGMFYWRRKKRLNPSQNP